MFKIKNYKIENLNKINPVDFFERFYNNLYNALIVSEDFTIIGVSPYMIVSYKNDKIFVELENIKKTQDTNWKIFLKDLFSKIDFNTYPLTKIGFIGYFSYDFKDKIEKLKNKGFFNYKMPLFEFVLYNSYYVFSKSENKIYKIDLEFENKSEIKIKTNYPNGISVNNFIFENSKNEYINKVNLIKKYIYEGDIYEANFTQQVKAKFIGNPYMIFKKLFKLNPAPYSAFLNFKSVIISNSPELFLSVEKNKVKTKPIKGTIARGNNISQDKINKQILEKSLKDRAELNMIIDLLRNDISKVCQYKTVRVLSKGHIEAFENVFHLVGEVEGILNNDLVELIVATFPGGSITGCPKIRAMEIIEETEKYKRNLYTGSIMVINNTNLISNIVIRTIIIQNNDLYFNAGGAITIDSNPEKEYEEFKAKISTILKVFNYDNIL